MKTLAILLLASLSLTACATDDTNAPGSGLRPSYKPDLADRLLTGEPKVADETADIDEGVSDVVRVTKDRPLDRLDHGSFVPEWAEEVKISDKTFTLLHAASGETLLVADDE